ncbi:UBX domain-containing protein 11, variant 2 [Clonorchis sinensis]|nr:UBX domain-containing protein 11, variant 2 [Clonorchis sinensis]
MKNEVIEEQAKRIKETEHKVAILQAALDVPGPDKNRVEILQNCCERLQRQVFEMEEFLHDYGLVWVGTQTTADLTDPSESGPIGLRFGTPEKNNVIFDKIVAQIHALNEWVGQDELEVCRDPKYLNRAYLKERSVIPITIYADGICLYRGPFRAFHEQSTMQFIQDILDGYFPSELQQEFPGGVPFSLTDKRTEYFNHKDQVGRSGSPRRKDCGPFELNETQKSIKRLSDDAPGLSENCGHKQGTERERLEEAGLDPTLDFEPLTMNDLLKRLPEKSITKSGQIVNIRQDIQAKFGSQSGEYAVQQVNLQPHVNEDLSSVPGAVSKFLSLRVRSEDGSHIYNLRMASTDTVKQLYNCLNLARSDTNPYHLVTMAAVQSTSDNTTDRYYRQTLDNMDATLEEAGLGTRTMLRMEKTKEVKFSSDLSRLFTGPVLTQCEWKPPTSLTIGRETVDETHCQTNSENGCQTTRRQD